MSSAQVKQVGSLLASLGLGFVSAHGYRAYREQNGAKGHLNSPKADLQAPALAQFAQMTEGQKEADPESSPGTGDIPSHKPDPIDGMRPEEVKRDDFSDLDLKIRDPKTEEVIGNVSIKVKGTIEIPEMPIAPGKEEAVLGGNKVEDLGQIVLESREITNADWKFV